MTASCFIRLSSGVVILIPRPAQNPWKTSWNLISEVKRRFRSPVTVLQRTSTRLIPWKFPPSPFGVITTVCQALLSEIFPLRNAACTMATTFSHWVEIGYFSHVTYWSHCWRCSDSMPDGPPKRFRRSLHNSQEISLYFGTDYLIGNGVTPMGIDCPGDGTFRYSSTLFSIMWLMVTLDGGGEISTTSLYHSFTRIHNSLISGRL